MVAVQLMLMLLLASLPVSASHNISDEGGVEDEDDEEAKGSIGRKVPAVRTRSASDARLAVSTPGCWMR